MITMGKIHLIPPSVLIWAARFDLYKNPFHHETNSQKKCFVHDRDTKHSLVRFFVRGIIPVVRLFRIALAGK